MQNSQIPSNSNEMQNFSLQQKNAYWEIIEGSVQIFMVIEAANNLPSNQIFLAQINSGDLIFAFDEYTIKLSENSENYRLKLIARCDKNSKILRQSLDELANKEWDFDLLIKLENWIMNIDRAISILFPVPSVIDLIEADDEIYISDDKFISAPHKSVIWLKLQQGQAWYYDNQHLPLQNEVITPLTQWSYIHTLGNDNKFTGYFSTFLLDGERAIQAINDYNHLISNAIAQYYQKYKKNNAQEILLNAERISAVNNQLNDKLFGIFQSDMNHWIGNQFIHPYLKICLILGKQMNVKIHEKIILQAINKNADLIEIFKICGFRMRKVRIDNNDWQDKDSGYIVSFFKNTMRIAVLMPEQGLNYQYFDPIEGEVKKLTPILKNKLAPNGWMLYPPIRNIVGNIGDLIKVAMFGQKQNILKISSIALFSGFLTLLTPILTGKILTIYIPSQEISMFGLAIMALFAASIGKFVFAINNAINIIRISNRMGMYVQSAIWDKLLKLPIAFFHEFAAGDLMNRAHGIDAIRQKLSIQLITTIVALLTGLTNIFVMWYYEAKLLWLVLVISFLFITISLILALFQLPNYIKIQNYQGKMDGLIYQLCHLLIKIRLANREDYALNEFISHYAKQKHHKFTQLKKHAISFVFNAISSNIFMLCILTFVSISLLNNNIDLEVQNFIAFNSSLGQFLMAMITAVYAMSNLVSLFPIYHRLLPIINAKNENNIQHNKVEKFYGKIEFRNVSFRYTPELPLVLEDFNLSVKAGSFVAITGETGTGKSTLAQLLLALYKLNSGSIAIDNQDVETINPHELRTQIGLVMQNSELFAGTILENVLIDNIDADEADVMEVLKKVGMEQEIKDFPLGINTMISEKSLGISAGQKQKIIIARALLRNPRILILDEATTAIDNIHQKIIGRTIENLTITRIVITHRYNSIQNADIIYFMEKGKIVESGTYQELINNNGKFAYIAKQHQT